MRTIKASEFKAKCLKLMDEVQATGEEIVVTKNGKPVAKISGMTGGRKGKFFYGAGKGKVEITGDIVSGEPELWIDRPWPKGAAPKRRRPAPA
jgi:prevent-host-death family protein